MNRWVLRMALCALAWVPPASAKVENSSAIGFSLAYGADIAVPPDVAYAKFIEIGRWWSSEHTYSGDARNLALNPERGGCWCESLSGGFVHHLSVVDAQPGKLLVFSGGLGPLAFMGVSGALSVSFEAKGSGAHVAMHYAVGGYDPDAFKTLPADVDKVMGANFDSYAAFAAKP